MGRTTNSILSPDVWNVTGFRSVWKYIDAVLDALSTNSPLPPEPAWRLPSYDPAANGTIRPLRARRRHHDVIDNRAIDVKRNIDYFEGSLCPYGDHQPIGGVELATTVTALPTCTASGADRRSCGSQQEYGRYCLVTSW